MGNPGQAARWIVGARNILTTHSTEQDIIKRLELGADGFLVKPFGGSDRARTRDRSPAELRTGLSNHRRGATQLAQGERINLMATSALLRRA